MKFQKVATIIIIIMLAINTIGMISLAQKTKEIDRLVHYVMEDTTYLRNFLIDF